MEKFDFDAVVYGDVVSLAKHGMGYLVEQVQYRIFENDCTYNEIYEGVTEKYPEAEEFLWNADEGVLKDILLPCLSIDEDSLRFDADETGNLGSARQVAFDVTCSIDMEKLGEKLGEKLELETKEQER